MNINLDKKYLDHKVFGQLTDYAKFYSSLSFSIMHLLKPGTQSILNLDTYVYSSIQGTLESIMDTLIKGRINDSYALLRKYYDSTVINIYSNLYLSVNVSIENFTVKQINDWVRGKEKLPDYRNMSKYIRECPKLMSITNLFHNAGKYKDIRERCNDHTHYNYYYNLLLNDNEIFLHDKRLKALDSYSSDLDDIFIQHFSYLFYLNDHYMMSSDYLDSLDLGLTPEKGSEYFVAQFIQDVFDKVIKKKRPDIAAEIKNKTAMKIQ